MKRISRRKFLIAGGTGLAALVTGGIVGLMGDHRKPPTSPYVPMPTNTATEEVEMFNQGLSSETPGAGVTGGNSVDFDQFVIRYLGASLIQYIPGYDLVGTVAKDYSSYRNDWTLSNSPTLNSLALSASTKRSISFDGVNQYGRTTDINFRNRFNVNEGTVFILAKMSGANVYTDGINRNLFQFSNSGYTRVFRIKKNPSNNEMGFNAGPSAFVIPFSNPNPFFAAITWSYNNSRAKAFFHGMKISQADNFITQSADVITEGCLGSATSGLWYHSGLLSNLGVLNVELSENDIALISNKLYSSLRMTFLGDSITQGRVWPSTVAGAINFGRCASVNRGASGAHIVENNDGISDLMTQVSAAATDNADKVYIEMGTNDGATDTVNIQNVIGTAVNTLRSSNPNCVIHFINIPPRFDAGQNTQGDKRTAIAAKCSELNVQCINTYDPPVWTDADLTDHLHPGASGDAKLAALVISQTG